MCLFFRGSYVSLSSVWHGIMCISPNWRHGSFFSFLFFLWHEERKYGVIVKSRWLHLPVHVCCTWPFVNPVYSFQSCSCGPAYLRSIIIVWKGNAGPMQQVYYTPELVFLIPARANLGATPVHIIPFRTKLEWTKFVLVRRHFDNLFRLCSIYPFFYFVK